MQRLRFAGAIAGVGSTSGVRFVVGRWTDSPLGPFADVMVEDASGHRTLLAPSDEVASFVQQTYEFDEVCTTPVSVGVTHDGWDVHVEGHLAAYLHLGPRMPLGWLLRAVPRRLSATPAWAAAIDPVARLADAQGSAPAGRPSRVGASGTPPPTCTPSPASGARGAACRWGGWPTSTHPAGSGSARRRLAHR